MADTKDINLTIATGNMANTNPPPEAMDQLSEQLNSNADLIAISLQEAKATWTHNEEVHERVIKRLNKGIEDKNEQYVLLHKDYFRVCTKLSLNNLFNPSRTSLGLFVKKKYLENAKILSANSEWSWNSPNKGGQNCVLKFGDKIVIFIGVHLDTKSSAEREKEVQALMPDEDSKLLKNYKGQINYIILGDLNERLDNRFKDDRNLNYQDLQKIQNNLINIYDPISNGKTYLTEKLEFSFQQLTELTYHETTKDGEVKFKESRSQYDIGALDNIGIKGPNLENNSVNSEVIELRDSDNHPISDHKVVITTLKLKNVDLSSSNNTRSQPNQLFLCSFVASQTFSESQTNETITKSSGSTERTT
ncbi:hypothetical protein L3V82_06835 [Thiotrichales bacterium 19S3-7]|nr:hypothetical protein [Thiotrichales bacterium 19S3-7]MCF6801924.1 hypothetical protein [Thiotrichales bacterium 19S3-11]